MFGDYAFMHEVQASNNDVNFQTICNQEEYQHQEEILCTVILENKGKQTLEHVQVKTDIPSEFEIISSSGEIKENQLVFFIESVDGGDVISFSYKMKLLENKEQQPVINVQKPGSGDVSSSGNTTNPQETGINNICYLAIGVILVVVGGVFLYVSPRKNKVLLLCVCAGLMTSRLAAIASEPTIELLEVSTIKVEGKTYTINTSITYTYKTIDVTELLLQKERIANAISLTWDNFTGGTYTILKGTDPQNLEVLLENVTDNYIIDTEIVNEVTYYYQVLLYQNGEEVKSSNVVEVRAYIDTDTDGLVDELELLYGTDINNPDTDGDGLSDGHEVLMYETNPLVEDTDGDGLSDYEEVMYTLTNPNSVDSDNNGVWDGDEDLEQDGLTNLREMQYGTDPLFSDSDFDGLTDLEEIEVYKTNPTNSDTDNDKVNDGDEIKLGFNPLLNDTDQNGVLDGDEVISISREVSSEEVDSRVIPTIELSLLASQAESLSIKKVEENNGYFNEQVSGYIGSAYDFNLDGEFLSGTLSFKVDPKLFQDEEFEPAIYYIDVNNQSYELIENQSVNQETGVISAEIEHFSMYVLLNKKKFEEVFKTDIKDAVSDDEMNKPLDIVFAIDSSGSMSTNDPQNIRIQVVRDFIDFFAENDRGAIVDFDSSAKLLSELTTDKEKLKDAVGRIDASGGTSLSAAMKLGLNQFPYLTKDSMQTSEIDIIDQPFYDEGESQDVESIELEEQISEDEISNESLTGEYEEVVEGETYTLPVNDSLGVNATSEPRDAQRYIILLTDGEGSYNHIYTQEAIAKGVKVHTIGLGSEVDEVLLKQIAEETGGNYYFAEEANDLLDEMESSREETIDLVRDSNFNGISDYHEKLMRSGELLLYNSNRIECPAASDKSVPEDYDMCFLPNVSDHDGDGLNDGEEYIIKRRAIDGKLYVIELSSPLFYDTDGDGINDKDDQNKLKYDVNTWKLATAANEVYENRSLEDSLQKPLGVCRGGKDEMNRDKEASIGCWKLIYMNNSNTLVPEFDFGLGMMAIEHEDNIIISFRGTETLQAKDWLTDFLLYLTGESPQSYHAVKNYKNIINSLRNNSSTSIKNKKIYLTGHSLGGFLTQDVLFELYQQGFDVLPTQSATFNAPGFAWGKFFDSDIRAQLMTKLTNYWIQYDLVGDFLGTKAGFRLGYDHSPCFVRKPFFGYFTAAVHGMENFEYKLANRVYY